MPYSVEKNPSALMKRLNLSERDFRVVLLLLDLNFSRKKLLETIKPYSNPAKPETFAGCCTALG